MGEEVEEDWRRVMGTMARRYHKEDRLKEIVEESKHKTVGRGGGMGASMLMRLVEEPVGRIIGSGKRVIAVAFGR
jgi:hypothetical protein